MRIRPLKWVVVAAMFALVGCVDNISNDEIVKQTKFCHDNGMGIKIHRLFGDTATQIYAIECDPSKKP